MGCDSLLYRFVAERPNETRIFAPMRSAADGRAAPKIKVKFRTDAAATRLVP